MNAINARFIVQQDTSLRARMRAGTYRSPIQGSTMKNVPMFRKTPFLILVLTLAVAATLGKPVATQGRGQPPGGIIVVNGAEAVAGEAILKYTADANDADKQDVNRRIDADEDVAIGGAGARRVHSRSLDTPAMLNFLKAHGKIAFAEPNYIIHAIATPNDPSFGMLWGLQNTGQTIGCGANCFGSPTGAAGADISATLAWDISTGSRANVVGVVDTGIDYNHPDLMANVWTSPQDFTVTVGGASVTCLAGTHG